MVDIVDRDTVASHVIPYGKQTAKDIGVTHLECLVTNHVGSPSIQAGQVEVVKVVTSGRHDVNHTVGDAHELIALLLHHIGVSIAVIPAVHDYVLSLHGSLTLSVCQCTPYASLLAEALNEADVVVSECTELLNHLLVLVRVLVSTDVHLLTYEYGIITLEVLSEERVKESIHIGVEEVEVVNTILLGTKLLAEVSEGQ